MLTDFQHINRLYNPPAQRLNRSSYSSEVRQNERQNYGFETGTKSKTISKEYYKTSATVHAETAQSSSKENFNTICFGEKDKMGN